MPFYLYTETAFHHQGDYDYMIGLINASKEAGAKGIKFQVLLKLSNLMSPKHSIYNNLTSTIFSYAEWKSVFKHCNDVGLEIIFMPCDVDSFSLIEDPEIKIDYIDIHSVSFYDQDVLQAIKKARIPVILGIGGRTVSEIDDKIAFFKDQLHVLMVGFQSFPSQLEDVKLGKIKVLREKYPNLIIGYADHSSFSSEHAIISNEYAYILGARYFEKHLTLDEGKERLDFQSAIGTEKMKQVVDRLHFLDQKVFTFNDEQLLAVEGKEIVYRNRQKTAVAARDLKKGESLDESCIAFKMIDKSNGEVSAQPFIGKTAMEDIEQYDILTLEKVV